MAWKSFQFPNHQVIAKFNFAICSCHSGFILKKHKSMTSCNFSNVLSEEDGRVGKYLRGGGDFILQGKERLPIHINFCKSLQRYPNLICKPLSPSTALLTDFKRKLLHQYYTIAEMWQLLFSFVAFFFLFCFIFLA